jgi:hypothetical protein
MSMLARATFEVRSWDEKPYHEGEGMPKLTRARVEKSLSGDIVGESTVEYLMAYRADGSANFVGHERIDGTLGGRTGTFVLEHTGTFEGGVATAKWIVVPGSGTGELVGLSGEGGFASAHADRYEMTLSYSLD